MGDEVAVVVLVGRLGNTHSDAAVAALRLWASTAWSSSASVSLVHFAAGADRAAAAIARAAQTLAPLPGAAGGQPRRRTLVLHVLGEHTLVGTGADSALRTAMDPPPSEPRSAAFVEVLSVAAAELEKAAPDASVLLVLDDTCHPPRRALTVDGVRSALSAASARRPVACVALFTCTPVTAPVLSDEEVFSAPSALHPRWFRALQAEMARGWRPSAESASALCAATNGAVGDAADSPTLEWAATPVRSDQPFAVFTTYGASVANAVAASLGMPPAAMAPPVQTKRARSPSDFVEDGGSVAGGTAPRYAAAVSAPAAVPAAAPAAVPAPPPQDLLDFADAVAVTAGPGGPTTYHCTLCDRYMTCLDAYKAHVAGKDHFKRLRNRGQPNPQDVKGNPENYFFCDICKTSISGRTNIALHCQGREHQSRAARLGLQQREQMQPPADQGYSV